MRKGIAVSLAAFLCAGSVYGACLVNLSTGYDNAAEAVFDITGGELDDDYLLAGPPGDGLFPVVVDHTVFPVGPWLGPDENSLWISLTQDANAPPGQYTFEISFEVPPAVDPTTLTLEGRWATDDNSVDILVNGVSTGITSGGFTMWADWPADAALGLFKEGINTVAFVVQNGGEAVNPMGLRVEGCVVAPPDTPEERPYNVSTGFDETARQVLADGAADENFSLEGPAGSGISGKPVAVPPLAEWWPDTINSRWIGPATPNAAGPAGQYTYTVTVRLPAGEIDSSRAILKGGFTADSFVADVLVNGVSTGITSGDFSRLWTFPVDAGQGFFTEGENTVSFIVEKNEQGPTGLRVDAQVVEGPPIPEADVSMMVLDTGFDDAGGAVIPNGMPDDNWVLVGPPGSDIGPVLAAVVPDDLYPVAPAGPWIGTSERSKWIGTEQASSNGPAGLFTFRIKVEVPEGLEAETLALSGFMSSDNAGRDVLLNGVSTGWAPSGNFAVLEPIPEGVGRGLFHTGVNTIEVLVENATPGPVGLRVEAVVGTGAVSETRIVSGLDERTGLPLLPGAGDGRFRVIPPAGDPFTPVALQAAGIEARSWLANSAESQWIGLEAVDSIGQPGVYTYEIRFDMPPYFNPARVELQGGWTAAQRGADLIVNVTALGLSAEDPAAFAAFAPGAGKGYFKTGLNRIQFKVENAAQGPTGLRVEARIAAVPEANPFDISTGFDQEGAQVLAELDLDEDYLVTLPSAEQEQAAVVGPPDPGWLRNTETSLWIGPPSALQAEPGSYGYEIVVDIPASVRAEAAYLAGVWAADDSGTDIQVNSASTGAATTGGFTGFTPFPQQLGKGLFQVGANTISFLVNNGGTGPNPSALRVDAVLVVETTGGETTFVRGDANADGSLNIADAVFVLAFLFANGTEPSCLDAADGNDDGGLNIADAVAILSHLFAGTGDLPPPFSRCDTDPTGDDLSCLDFEPCGG